MTTAKRVVLFVCAMVAWSTAASAQQKYFGYWGSQFIGGNPNPCSNSAFGGHINVVWIYMASAADADDAATAISSAAACGKKSVLVVQQAFFTAGELPWSHTYHTGSYSGADSGINSAIATMQTELAAQLDNIVGFHLYDEPFWHAQNDFDDSNAPLTCDGLSNVSGRNCHRLLDLQYVSGKMKAAFPDQQLMLTFAYPELIDWHGAYLPKIPNNVDWVGFNCYMDSSPGTFDECYTGISIPDFVDELKSFVTGAQKLFIVPPAFVPVTTSGSGCPSPSDPTSGRVADLVSFLQDYRDLADSEPLITGVFPYTYSSHCSGGGPLYYWGTDDADLDAAHDELVDWGEEVIAGYSDVDLVIDLPSHLSTHTQGFTLAGWALDKGALTGTGISFLRAYAVRVSDSAAMFYVDLSVAATSYGGTRTDVAAIYGPQFRKSGYGYSFGISPSLPPGTYDIVVYPYSSVTNAFDYGAAQYKRVTIPASSVQGYLDTPSNNATVGNPFSIGGWAIDANAPYGTGINAVDVWACPTTGCGSSSEYAIYLGPASFGARSDIASIYGSQFLNSGYGKSISTLSAGTYDIFVYARSTLTGTWTQWTVRVTVT